MSTSNNSAAGNTYIRSTVDKLNANVVEAQYAVRGTVPIAAAKIREQLKAGAKYPFSDITECNIGNPQSFGQKPISFFREVIAGTLSPSLLESAQGVNKDVRERVRYYAQNIRGNVGAYSDSLGYDFVRRSVAQYIQQRDGLQAPPSTANLMLLDGASQGVHMVLQTLVGTGRDGVMIPIPQYPLYTASIALQGAQEVHYYLDEEGGWSITVDELERQYLSARRHGITPKVLVVINPGNPTGQVLDASTIEQIIRFATAKNLVVFADEVYQQNIYSAGKQFISFNSVRNRLPPPYNSIELYSFHSTSKGLLGECGIRGGYLHMENVDDAVRDQIVKLKSINLCSNTTGQLMTDLMVNPPNRKTASEDTVRQYEKETADLLASLIRRARIVGDSLKTFTNMTCNDVEGAMYAFPQVRFSKKFIEEAQRRKMEPDLLYCLDVLQNTGIVLVPGSGFGQKEGTYHFRITTLILPEDVLQQKMKIFKDYNSQFHQKWQ